MPRLTIENKKRKLLQMLEKVSQKLEKNEQEKKKILQEIEKINDKPDKKQVKEETKKIKLEQKKEETKKRHYEIYRKFVDSGCDYEYTAKMLDYSTDSVMNIISKIKREIRKNIKMTKEQRNEF